jgi:hypothetical protein
MVLKKIPQWPAENEGMLCARVLKTEKYQSPATTTTGRKEKKMASGHLSKL